MTKHRMMDDGDEAGPVAAVESDEVLQAFLADQSWVHYVGMLSRPGVMDCMASLEHTHYPPDTPRNALFQLRIFNWSDLRWAMISIPVAEKEFMERAAAAHGLRVADGIPHVFGPEGMARFPANGPRVFALSNVSGHPVYGRGRTRKEAAP